MSLRQCSWVVGCLVVLLLLAPIALQAGTTGKIVGTVTDAETGDPLVGANVVVKDTQRGAATDLDGEYLILNLPPGTYTVTFSNLGYQTVQMTDVQVSIDKTVHLDAELKPTVLQAAPTVTVTAQKPVVKKDLTSTEVSVNTEDIKMMPVENFGDVVQLQAGVVNGHFRGGRSNEVVFMIDGVIVSDPYKSSDPFGRETNNTVENSAIQEIQVVSGTFNAEYGQAMSGIVNVVTKEGSPTKYSGEISLAAGDYVSGRSIDVGYYDNQAGLLTYNDQLSPKALQDYQFSVSGPVPQMKGKLTFFANGRYLNDSGSLYGKRVFEPSDSSNFSSSNPDNWYIERSGDGKVMTLNPFRKYNGQGKLTYRFENGAKLSYQILADNMKYRNLDNLVPQDDVEDPRKFKYNPDGMYWQYGTGMNQILSFNQALSEKSFYTLNLSYTKNTYKFYVHENPNDPAYVRQERLQDAQNYAFYTGGQGMWHQDRSTRKAGVKFDITTQANKLHQLKAGIDLNQYSLQLEEYQLVWDDQLNKLKINPLSSWNHNRYPNKSADSPLGGFPFSSPGFRPLSFSTYLQDKVEYDFMIVNVGVRLDYFHPDAEVPTDLRDPGNDHFSYYDPAADTTINNLDPINPVNPDGSYNPWHYKYRTAKPVTQLSPRVGIAFPITAKGVLHFSYGHFFQIPPFQYLYYNPEFEVLPGQLQSRIGNGELKPERTVMYEVGLQQEIAEGTGLNITGFYKDVRNLLGMEVLRTYDQKIYARYINRDYGNVRGITIALDRRMSNLFSASIDYTYQVAEGNSSDPNDVFYNNQADPPRETIKKVIPLDWDQTHTVNFNLNIGDPGDWGVSFVGRMGSGLPYTATPFLKEEGATNGARRPAHYNIDLKTYKTWDLGGLRTTLTLNVYNLFDIRNENDVFTDTGRATYTLERNQAFSVQGYNNLDDYFTHPEYFSSPRQVKLGLSIGF